MAGEEREWPEYDSDDMSAGGRLMRYYVSDDPPPDSSVSRQSHKQLDKVQPRRTASAPEAQYSSAQISSAQAAQRASARPAVDLDEEDLEAETEPSDSNRFAEDDTTFRGDLDQLRGDVLYGIAGRHSHRDILSKIARFHPQAQFGSRDLTYRMANALKTRARKQGVSRQAVKQELDEIRNANGVEFMQGHYAADKKTDNAQQVDKEADAAFRGPADQMKGEVLLQLAGRYTHDQILAGVKTHHPDTKLTSILLTERLSEAMRAKAIHENKQYADVKNALNALRDSNGVPYARHTGSSTQHMAPIKIRTSVSSAIVIADSDEDDLLDEET